MLKSRSHSKSYFIEGLPLPPDDSFKRDLDEHFGALERGGNCLVFFDLPEDRVPKLELEAFSQKPKYRIAPLECCREHFSTIWEMTAAFGSHLLLFTLEKEERYTAALQDGIGYLELLPRRVRVHSEIEIGNTGIKKRNKPTLLLALFWDGQFLLITSSPEFLSLLRTILSILGIETQVDQPDFDRWASNNTSR